MPLLDDAIKAAKDEPLTKEVKVSITPEKGRAEAKVETEHVSFVAWVERVWKKTVNYGADLKVRFLR